MERAKVKKDRFPVFRERFRELQGEMNDVEFGKLLGISRQTVGFYRNGDRIPDALGLCDIAQKCSVSADYLLGLADVPSANQDVRQICNTTGLSEKFIEYTLEIGETEKAGLNAFLGDTELIKDIAGYIGGMKDFFPELQKKNRGISEEIRNEHSINRLFIQSLRHLNYYQTIYSDIRLMRFEIIDYFTKFIGNIYNNDIVIDEVGELFDQLGRIKDEFYEKYPVDNIEQDFCFRENALIVGEIAEKRSEAMQNSNGEKRK